MYRKFLKPIFDIVFSLIVLIVLLPLNVLLILMLWINNRGNPFFVQKRPGKGEKIFKLIKYRTMTNKCDERGKLLPDSERLTRFGKLLRKLSLDELPQFINIIKGDMSLIGPRPLLIEYLPRFNEFQKRRHEVRPGITGWAQVNGRNTISWGKKFEYDVWYVDNLSLLIDIRIFFKSIKKVILKEGINRSINSPEEEFMGNSEK